MSNTSTSTQGGFNLREAAEFIGTNHTTMSALVKTPGFPAFRLGRRWVIPRDQLVAWMNEQAKQRAAIETAPRQVMTCE